VTGRKRQLLVDTLGFPLAWRVEPANMSDKKAARYLVGGLSPLWPRIEMVIADAGYLSEKLSSRPKPVGRLPSSSEASPNSPLSA